MNTAIQAGGEAYFRYRQIEMIPTIMPAIAAALSDARFITFSSSGEKGAPETTANDITQVIKTVLAAQMVAKGGMLDSESEPKSKK